MLRNLYILSEGSWAIKSAEIFADLFYTLSLLVLVSVFFVLRPDLYAVPALVLFVLLSIYYFYLYKKKLPIYTFALLSQYLLFLLLVPIAFLHPLVLSLSALTACVFHVFLIRQYGVRIQLTFYLLFFVYLWDALFSLVGFPMHATTPESFLFPVIQKIESNALGPLFSMPWLVGKDFDVLTFRSGFEYLSTFVLIGVSWVAFRRPVLVLFFIGWFLAFFSFGTLSARLPIAWVVSFASIAFVLHIAPGRNFYGSFFLSMISFLFLMPIAWIVGKVGGQPVMLLLIFFPLEAVMVRVFLGK